MYLLQNYCNRLLHFMSLNDCEQAHTWHDTHSHTKPNQKKSDIIIRDTWWVTTLLATKMTTTTTTVRGTCYFELNDLYPSILLYLNIYKYLTFVSFIISRIRRIHQKKGVQIKKPLVFVKWQTQTDLLMCSIMICSLGLFHFVIIFNQCVAAWLHLFMRAHSFLLFRSHIVCGELIIIGLAATNGV